MIRRRIFGLALAPALCLAGCAPPSAPTAAEQAEATACTAQADATYDANNVDALSRTSQNGVFFAPDPNRVFDSQRLGSLHERDSQITDCEQNGSSAGSIPPGTPIVTPQIIGQ
jgi:hypothetical protein